MLFKARCLITFNEGILMSHWTGNSYVFKLNEQATDYSALVEHIKNDFTRLQNQAHEQGGEYWSGSLKQDNNVIRIYMTAKKSGAAELGNQTLRQVEQHIKADKTHQSYVYEYDSGECEGLIMHATGEKITALIKKIQQANISLKKNQSREVYIDQLEHYLHHPENISQLEKEGEKVRLLESLKNQAYQTQTVFGKCFTGENRHKLDQRWLIYFLAYGTSDLLDAQTSPVHRSWVSLKEILYIEDNDQNPSSWGSQVLKYFIQKGVDFTDCPVSGHLYKYGRFGYATQKVKENEIHNWFEANANNETFIAYPQFSVEVTQWLEKHYPATLDKLNQKIQSLDVSINLSDQKNKSVI
jgi:hypothetical protein